MKALERRVAGIVVRGDGRGRELGFPTANIDTPDQLPSAGVYAAWVRIGPNDHEDGFNARGAGAWHEATVSVGNNPTFGDVALERAECFLHDFSGDLYGKHLEIAFVAYIREMAAFSEIDELIANAASDVRRSRTVLVQHPPEFAER